MFVTLCEKLKSPTWLLLLSQGVQTSAATVFWQRACVSAHVGTFRVNHSQSFRVNNNRCSTPLFIRLPFLVNTRVQVHSACGCLFIPQAPGCIDALCSEQLLVAQACSAGNTSISQGVHWRGAPFV